MHFHVVGNMIDKKREVSKKDAIDAASRLGVDYIEASSLENINIEKVSIYTVVVSCPGLAVLFNVAC